MVKNNVICISGINGFIGRNLKVNLENSYKITNFDRIDLKNSSKMTQKINDTSAKVIIHLAGLAHNTNRTDLLQDHNYYYTNTELTKNIYNAFLNSNAHTFIFMSSVKAVSDNPVNIVTENTSPNPQSVYGKSKLLAENFILSQRIPNNKRFFILRPSLVFGPGVKGNLNMLVKLVKNRIPYPLGLYENQRTYCSIENLNFIIEEIIENHEISSGIYNVSDNDRLSTKELINLISTKLNVKPLIYNIPKFLILPIAKIGDIFNLKFNTDSLLKLTENFIVSNDKIVTSMKKKLPYSTYDAILKSINNS